MFLIQRWDTSVSKIITLTKTMAFGSFMDVIGSYAQSMATYSKGGLK